jgi:septal ring factor EnvC (AmiA/AmiB activator)
MITSIFISSVPSPASLEVAGWVGCLFFLAAGWNQVEKFFDRRAQRGALREIQPQPLAVTRVDSPVSESLCQSRRKEVSNELARFDQELGCLRRERRTEVSELQQKINKVDREVGELRTSIELSNQQLMRIDAKLERMIERRNV